MKRYQPGTSRTLMGFAAILMTAVTLGTAVFAPAAIHYGSQEIDIVTSAGETATYAASDRAPTTSIDVVAVRGTRLVPAVHARAPSKHQV